MSLFSPLRPSPLYINPLLFAAVSLHSRLTLSSFPLAEPDNEPDLYPKAEKLTPLHRAPCKNQELIQVDEKKKRNKETRVCVSFDSNHFHLGRKHVLPRYQGWFLCLNKSLSCARRGTPGQGFAQEFSLREQIGRQGLWGEIGESLCPLFTVESRAPRWDVAPGRIGDPALL